MRDSFRAGKQKMKLGIKPAAETVGLTLESLGRQVCQAFYGEEAQRIQRGRDLGGPGVGEGLGQSGRARPRIPPGGGAELADGDRIAAGGDMSEAITAIPRNDSVERHRATYQDVLDAPPHRVAEVVDGVLHTNPRPAMRHAHASSSLGTKIGGPFHHDEGGPGGWWIIDEPELHLGEDILVPDLAGWRRERMPVFPDAPYATLAPDWVCEVLSPSTRKLDLHGKRAAYGREQVGHLWLVDPADRTLEAFELCEGEWVLIATAQDDAPVRIRPFDAVTFSLGALWPPKVAPAE